eukprot:XP_010645693.1 PREDICTED: crossover junction endonuclease MUS81 isoform X3 [Vitis vinifera]
MENQGRVVCPENEELAAFLWRKRQEMAEQPKGISENIDLTLYRAYSNVCRSEVPVKTLKEFSQIKQWGLLTLFPLSAWNGLVYICGRGVGKWILRLMQEYFKADSGTSEPQDLSEKGKKAKGTKRYMPQKNSVAYALLIALYRGTATGSDFMGKQDLINAAEASGLSRVPIVPEKEKGKRGHFGSSSREWYSGWSCMKTLITKGLVVKSSCPAKYMLTQEGREAAHECLLRSGLADPIENLAATETTYLGTSNVLDLEFDHADLDEEDTIHSCLNGQKKSVDVPLESLEKFTRMGYTREEVLRAFTEVAETSQKKGMSSLWPAVLCCLRENQVYGFHSESQANLREDCLSTATTHTFIDGQVDLISENSQMDSACGGPLLMPKSSHPVDSVQSSFTLRACSSSDYPVQKLNSDGLKVNMNVLTMPPLLVGERFEDVYEVVLILDDREQFTTQGSRSRKIIENICTQFKIQIEVRRLPVGDGIWVARHKHLDSEYVLDFIVERKNVNDLRCSIRDNRYKDQKLRLLRCGLKKLIYLVEGDPNSSEAAESIKTACFTTEILEGFDVQRTSGLADTLRKYGYLTQAIAHSYRLQVIEDKLKNTSVCPPFNEFIRSCNGLDKMTVSDVFAIQLMQVPQVTEEVAVVVLDLYPTLLSLARAYSLLDGDILAQEEMLRKQSNNMVNAVASRNIFKLVWGD